MEISNQWDAQWEVSEELAYQLISNQFPELGSKIIQKLGNGWDNTVFTVGNEYVFRFPRREIAINLLKVEGNILPKLKDFLSIPYPIPLFFGQADDGYPAPFLGYTYLPGEFPIGLTDAQRTTSSKKLAKFLRGLHSVPEQIAVENGIQQDHRNLTDIAARKERLQQFISDIGTHFSEEVYNELTKYLDELNVDRVKPKNVLLHGDLHFKNMLVDQDGIISGIIDWGDVNIGHPACDLNVVYSFLPPETRADFFMEYGEIDEESKRLARLIAIYIPILIMMQAIDEQDARVVDEARATIERALAD